MIFVNKHEVSEADFTLLLENSRKKLLDFFQTNPNVNFSKFEGLVCEAMQDVATGTEFEGTIQQTGTYAFPDIVANKFYGVEVKHTTKNHWTSTGNSILETNRVDGVERIFMFFGKFGGDVDIKFRPYQECLYAVSVTHSPRYRIDMNLGNDLSIFSKMNTDYDTLRKSENPIKEIKDYYRSQLKDGEEMWWIDADADDREVSPIIKPFRSLERDVQNQFFLEALVLFPEMFGNSNAKFERAAAYLVSEYNAVNASLRDLFTAGGKKQIDAETGKIKVSQLYYKVYASATEIRAVIEDMSEEKLINYWRVDALETDRVSQWLKMVSSHEKDDLEVFLAPIFEIGIEDHEG